MTQKHDGGPAYPHDVFIKTPDGIPHLAEREFGMTLRDYFAGQVIVSVKAWHPADKQGKSAAVIAYEIADAMLAARSGGET